VNFPRPPISPLPPRDGDLARVRRRALLRRLRAPGAGLASVALVLVAFNAVPAPKATSRLQPVTTFSADPTETPTADPIPDPPTPSQPTSSPATTLVVPPFVPSTPTTTPPPDPMQVCSAGGGRGIGPEITGVVVDKAGNPLPNISITATVCKDGGSHEGVVADKTDAQGRFAIPCMGRWAVAAPFAWYTGVRSTSADVGYAWFDDTEYRAIACGTTHRIVLPKAAGVHVQIVDAQNHPITEAGHRIDVFMAGDTTTPMVAIYTAADGTASFTGLRPGDYFLYESPRGYTPFTVTEGETAQANYRSSATASPTPTATATPTETPTPTTTSFVMP
jgi:hypothetical protein